jgi:hypothetical protein
MVINWCLEPLILKTGSFIWTGLFFGLIRNDMTPFRG